MTSMTQRIRSLEHKDEAANGPVLKAVNIGKKVTSPEGQLAILDQVSLEIFCGETVAIVGQSGAGKSTLLALLAGLDEATEGEVWLDGIALSGLDEDGRAARRAGRVGFVFQSFHLIPSLTAHENVMLPLELAGVADAAAHGPQPTELQARTSPV